MKERTTNTTRLDIEVSWQTRDVIVSLSKKLGLSRSDLCSLWLGMIDPNNEVLLKRSAQLLAKREVDKLSRTRKALIDKLTQRGVLSKIDDMSNEEIEAMINRIAKRRQKNK